MTYARRAAYAAAESMHHRALGIRRRAFGPDHPATTQSLDNLAALYRAQNRHEDAEAMLKQSLTIWEASAGKAHPPRRSVTTTWAPFMPPSDGTRKPRKRW
jgi:hypothetical protein